MLEQSDGRGVINRGQYLQNIRTLQTNLDRPFRFSQTFLPRMTDGTIIRIQRCNWLDQFDTLEHNRITLYEWEVYARTRMAALWLLCTATNEAEHSSTRAAAWDHWGLRLYPARSGAKKHILDSIDGGAAASREHAHQAIAMGFLALIARHNAAMRESLIYAELLWRRYQLSLLDGSPTEEEEDAELRQLCALFDRFWIRSNGNIFDSRSTHFVRTARAIERDWMERVRQ
jgi:hypothetical protein